MNNIKSLLIGFSILVIGVFLIQWLQKSRVIEGLANQNDVIAQSNTNTGSICPKCCNAPTKTSGKCDAQIYKDDDGKCYKLCPLECTDPLAGCQNENYCDECDKVKLYVDCVTGEQINDGPDINDSTQESNYSSSSINTGTTKTSKNELQGSLVINDTNASDDDDDGDDDNSNGKPSSMKPFTSPYMPTPPGTVIENNYYYGVLLPPDMKQVSYENAVTSNPYRLGGIVQTIPQDASSIMNYGAYRTPMGVNAASIYDQTTPVPPPAPASASTPPPAQSIPTTTGMFNQDASATPYDSLYSLKF